MNNEYEFYAISIKQPLGIFYAVSIPSNVLLQVCYSSKMDFNKNSEGEVKAETTLLGNLASLVGTQRENDKKRLEEIKKFIKQVDSHFPNSIILGANYTEDGEYVYDKENCWTVEYIENNLYKLKIPTLDRLASIIDGQHRVFAFKDLDFSMDLLCSVYLDLPIPYHAQIFLDINTNQKKIDKNLAYNFFQYDIVQGEINAWSPEALAVYFTRMLASQNDSPLNGKIKIGVGERDQNNISLGCVVDGILSLITSNAKNDRMKLHEVSLNNRNRKVLSELSSSAPLRSLYVNNKNKSLYNIILNYLKVITKKLWVDNNYSIFQKSLGIYTVFDILKEIINQEIKLNDEELDRFSLEFFDNKVQIFSGINFNDPFFGVQTKVRKRIKDIVYFKLGYINQEELLQRAKDKYEQKEYLRLLGIQ
ncbi:DGQHR domain-containing protein [Aliarcobacter cryaerophilus]|uniref:DGQHR domain-containing protein n=1 Tax=Aliarcobacter cryaerophilus TaxID=28198 RepID=UPI0021B64B8C|nr:DGQHR domain-containing protein [Aliarcobacter cryaerophilus]MCT7482123.1 DGQHR domain-containing protein [Aliarcobacter cryaerophilus]